MFKIDLKKGVYCFYTCDIYICCSFSFVSLPLNKTISVIFIGPSQQLSVLFFFLQDTEKQKGKQAMPEKHENEMSQVKQKSKKLLNVKKEIPTDVKTR